MRRLQRYACQKLYRILSVAAMDGGGRKFGSGMNRRTPDKIDSSLYCDGR